MELLFYRSPVAREKSRDLPRMGYSLSVNTFLVTLQQFRGRGVLVLWAALCLSAFWQGALKICLLELVQALVIQMYFTPGCAGGKSVELF